MVYRPVKVTRNGRITIPVGLRREFSIKEGDTLWVRKGKDGIELRVPGTFVARTAGIFRDYVGDQHLEWDSDEAWSQAARERFEHTLDESSFDEE